MASATSLQFALSAGEASGDVQGARLVNAIRRLEPDARFLGIGGPRMQAAGMELLYNSAHWGSIGVVESLKLVAPLTRAKNDLVRRFKENPPDLLIPIDFGYFNLRLAREARANGTKVLYYFPPKSWDRSAYVSPLLRDSVDAVATPFPWSAGRLQEAGVPTAFVGHPLLDNASDAPDKLSLCREWRLNPEKPIVALLPGSRGHEVQSLWPQMALAAILVTQEVPGAQFVVPVASSVKQEWLKLPKDGGVALKICFVPGRTTDVFAAADVVAACSGTATLEAAVLCKPMVILYGLSWLMALEWQLRKRRLALRFIGMPNIIADRMIATELLHKDATADKIAAEILSLLQNPERSDLMRKDLTEVSGYLGRPGAVERAAAIAVAMAHGDWSADIMAGLSLPLPGATSNAASTTALQEKA